MTTSNCRGNGESSPSILAPLGPVPAQWRIPDAGAFTGGNPPETTHASPPDQATCLGRRGIGSLNRPDQTNVFTDLQPFSDLPEIRCKRFCRWTKILPGTRRHHSVIPPNTSYKQRFRNQVL